MIKEQQMLYSEMARNNYGMTLGEMLFWLDVFSNFLMSTELELDLINAMERDGHIFSEFNEGHNRTEWFVYE